MERAVVKQSIQSPIILLTYNHTQFRMLDMCICVYIVNLILELEAAKNKVLHKETISKSAENNSSDEIIVLFFVLYIRFGNFIKDYTRAN